MWIRVETGLRDHPKTIALARELKLDANTVVGLLISLWSWAATNREDGVLTAYDIDVLPDVMRYRPKRGVDLIKVLATAPEGFDNGYLDDLGDGRYALHGWEEYAGKHLESLKASRERMARNRSKKSKQFANNSQTIREQFANSARMLRDNSNVTITRRNSNITKEKEYTIAAVDLESDISPEEIAKARTDIPAIEQICRAVGMGFTAFDHATASELLGEYSREDICDAINRAKERDKASWAYIKGILRRWKESGKDEGTPSAGVKGNPAKHVAAHNYVQREYGQEDEDALFDDITALNTKEDTAYGA